jgi:cytochrome P450
MEAPRTRLVSTRLAPPVEMARWLLEQRSIAYSEEAHVAGFHAFASWRRGLTIELPLVITAEGATGGVMDFLDALDGKCRAGEKVYGDKEEQRQEARALIELFHQKLFQPAVRLYYHHMLEHRRMVTEFAVQDAPWWESLLVRALFPLWKRVMSKGLRLDGFDPAAAVNDIRQVFAIVAGRVRDGERFLGGASPGSLDVVFASLASPVIMPARLCARHPEVADLPPALRTVVEEFRAHTAGRLAEAVYQTARGKPQPPMEMPRRERSLAGLILRPGLLLRVARIAARWKLRLAIGKTLVVSSWDDVREVLERDNEFRIAPVNKARIEAVSGPFILGMDRSPELFRQREAVYGALRGMDGGPARAVLRDEPRRLLENAFARHGQIDVVNGYARPIAARTAVAVFGIAGPSEQDLMRVVRAIFHETFLNIGGDADVANTGVAAGGELAAWIRTEIARRRSAGAMGRDVLGLLLSHQPSSGLPPESVSWMLSGLLVGAIDTTATAVCNIVAEMLADSNVGQSMLADIDNSPRFLGWCYELLRRRPHNPIVLRRTAIPLMLGNRAVPPNMTVFAATIAAMQDPGAFPDPSRMLPARPLQNYLHFGHGLHLCSGRDINGIQIPVLVRELLRYAPRALSGPRARGPFPDEFIVKLQGGLS